MLNQKMNLAILCLRLCERWKSIIHRQEKQVQATSSDTAGTCFSLKKSVSWE